MKTYLSTVLLLVASTSFSKPNIYGNFYIRDTVPFPSGTLIYSGSFTGELYFNKGESGEVMLKGLPGPNPRSFFIAKYDPDEKLLWARDSIAVENSNLQTFSIKPLPNETFLAHGSVGKHVTLGKGANSVGFDSTNGKNYLARFDEKGELDWARILPDEFSNELKGFFANDGSIFLARTRNWWGKDASIVKLSPDGKSVWLLPITGNTAVSVNAMYVLADGSLLVAGEYGGYRKGSQATFRKKSGELITVTSDSSDDDPAYDIFILKIDNEGHADWADNIWNYSILGREMQLTVKDDKILFSILHQGVHPYRFKPERPDTFTLTGKDPTLEYSMAGNLESVKFK